MATKTISIDIDAYEMLRRARLSSTESFSKVIKRARWKVPQRTAAAFLERCQDAPLVTQEGFERLDDAQRADRPPEDPWRTD